MTQMVYDGSLAHCPFLAAMVESELREITLQNLIRLVIGKFLQISAGKLQIGLAAPECIQGQLTVGFTMVFLVSHQLGNGNLLVVPVPAVKNLSAGNIFRPG